MAKVRIRKAGPGEQPGYRNKTSQFMQKAQLGGTADPQAFMKQLQGAVYGALQRNQEPEEIYNALISQKIDSKLANQVVASVYRQMIENGEIEDPSVAETETQTEEVVEEFPQPPNAGREQMDQYREQSMATAMEDDEEGDFAIDDRSYLEGDNPYYNLLDDETMQVGGQTNPVLAQYDNQIDSALDTDDMQTLINDTPGTQRMYFPGIEEYLQAYDPIAEGYNVDNPFIIEAKKGGATKKAFVKNIMGLLKKQEGGAEETPVVAEQKDDLTGSVKKKKQSFVDTVANTAKEVKIQEWFDNMQASGDPMLDQLAGVINGEPAPTPMAAKGGMMTPREYRKLYKFMGKSGLGAQDTNRMPQSGFTGYFDRNQMPGFTAASVPQMQKYYSQFAPKQHREVQDFMLPRISVEDTDIFGRPKRYMYDWYNPAEIQAKEAEVKNQVRASNLRVPYPGYMEEGVLNPAPEGSMIDLQEDTVYPPYFMNDQPYPKFLPFNQYGGFTDPSIPDLAKFAEGADTPELAKNINDPYFNDLTQAQFGRNIGRFLRGMSNQLAPINPFFGYSGSWQQQQGAPYSAASGNTYTGSMEGANPIGRHVTKTSMLSRRPKEWVDYYQTPGRTSGTLYKGSDGQLQYFNPSQSDMSDQMALDMDREGMKKRGNIDQETWGDLSLKSKAAIKTKEFLNRAQQKFGQNPKAQFGMNTVSNSNFSNSFAPSTACPPGYFKDPGTGMCKNFAGEPIMGNQGQSASANFQQGANEVINQNPFQATGTTPLGQNYGYTQADGTLGGLDLGYESSFDKQSELVGVNKKRKDMYGFSGEELVNTSITGRNALAGFIDTGRTAKQNLNFQNENFNSNKIFGSKQALDQGDWTQAGDFQKPNAGSDWVNRSMGKYGGSFQEGGFPTYDVASDMNEGDEVWMTDEEINQYLANGGEIEYL